MKRIPTGWVSGVAFGLLFGTMVVAVAEDITVTTYYPSPRGVYQDLRVLASFRFEGGTPGVGKVLTSDAAGQATWSNPAIPPGLIALFDPGPCPAGWTRFAALDGRVPRGAAGAGAVGGSDTHTHGVNVNFNHEHWSDPGGRWFGTDTQGFHDHVYWLLNHSHGFGVVSDSSGNYCAGSNDTNGTFVCADHRHNVWGTTYGNDWSAATWGGGNHNHNVWVDLPGWTVGGTMPSSTNSTSNPGSSWPPYRDMVFCRKNP